MQPICTKRTTLDVTTYLLFEVGHRELVIKGTDLEVSLQSTFPLIESDVEEPVKFLVLGKRLFDVVKELEEPINCTLDENQLHIRTSSVDVALNIRSCEGFPSFPERIENIMQLDSSIFLKFLNKVAFLIPQNNANPALNGLLIEISSNGLTLTTTDGHSLAQAKTSQYALSETKKWLVPRRAIFELKKLLECANEAPVFVGTCNNQIVFSGPAFNFFSKLLNSQFPDYLPILQRDGFVPASVDRQQLVKALRRASSLLSGNFIATQFVFEHDIVHVNMHNKEIGKLKEALVIDGAGQDGLDIRFYAPYLLGGLQAFAGERITFYLKAPTRPIIFNDAEEGGYEITYLVMPVSPSHAM